MIFRKDYEIALLRDHWIPQTFYSEPNTQKISLSIFSILLQSFGPRIGGDIYYHKVPLHLEPYGLWLDDVNLLYYFVFNYCGLETKPKSEGELLQVRK